MLVWSVYMPDAERRGPDLEQMNRVVDLPDELGRMRLNDGSARMPSEEELAAYREVQQADAKAADVKDLSVLPKSELEAMAADRKLDVSPKATKADFAAAIEAHDQQQGDAISGETGADQVI